MNNGLDIQPNDRLLVSRTDRLGDLILALPFVESLKARYPRSRVDVLASLYASPILENNKRIDGILRVQNDMLSSSRNYCKDFAHKIKLADYKAVVVLYPERKVSRLLYRVGIPHRYGTAGRFHSVFFNHRLLHSRKANKKHESEYNLDFLKYFGDGPVVRTPAVYPTEKELRNARRILDKAGIQNRFLVIHPGSGGSAERWPLERFVELTRELDRAGYQVLVTGSAEEGALIDRGLEKARTSVARITGQTDLRTLAAVLSLASAVVANSTGPLHLAVAVGTRVVGLYPGIRVMSPVRWGPVGEGHVVIQPTATDPEGGAPPPSMSTIEVDQVMEAVRDVYGNAIR